jgi:cellulose synthase/poly-beta-1,6-N-acetylglucosamine synthase-like glycosyltransferase
MFSDWWIYIFYCFCLVTAIQLFYYLFFFSKLAFYRQQEPQQASREHPVSVIICARDEAENLANNLPGVLVQSYRSTHEVIVVNDNSQDETKYLLEGLHKQFRHLNVVELKQEAKLIPGKKFPLSVGIKTAKYEIILLTDADCVPVSEYWIQKMQEAFVNDIEIVLGYGGFHKTKGILNKVIRFDTFHTALQYLSFALAGIPYMGVGRNLAYRRQLFFRHKGFASHNRISSGDDDLFINMAANENNTAVVLDKEAFTLSVPKNTFAGWWKQKNRHFSTGKYYKPLHRFLLGLYSLSYFLFYPLLVASFFVFDWKWVTGIFILRMTVQMITWFKCMDRLNETDLKPWFWFMDAWMFFYYFIFAASLWRKPRTNWK